MNKQDIERLKAGIAEMVADQSVSLREEIGASERRLGAMIEQVHHDVSGIADLVQRDDEKMENHERRISRLEDHADLPALEPVVEG